MKIRIALAGNPNSGKTTLFNALTGLNQYVGNWPGVTVEKKEGKLKNHDNIVVTDLPGIYSLSPYTLEEVVARKYLIDERPDVILNIIDGTNLERNLYLTTQLVEIGIPVVVAINMMDVVRKSGDDINTQELARLLGCRVVEISALKETGVSEAVKTVIEAAENGDIVPPHCFSGPVEHALAHIEEALFHDLPEEKQRFLAIKVFERDEKVLSELNYPPDKLKHIESDIKAAENELGDSSDAIIINERYNLVEHIIGKSYRKKTDVMSVSDKIDKVLTNRWLGLPIFGVIMFLIYYFSMVTVGTSATDWLADSLFGESWSFFGITVPGIPVVFENLLDKIAAAPWLKGLIIDGIVAGVGSVLSFVPQILALFFFLSFLEGCGYMSRIAFVLDRIFRRFGFSGKSFIPMLVSSGCGVPGIMASRTIENVRDRRMTIMTATFIPCSAKIPLISLIAGALFGGSALVAVSAYFIGVFSIIISGCILKKTRFFSSEVSPFVMELPAYHLPTFFSIVRTTWERVWSFIKKAGTIILLSTVVIWFVSHFGIVSGEGFRLLENEEIEFSIIAFVGNFLSFVFKPLGWGTWQASVASLTGLIAKENIVGSLVLLYNSSDQVLSSVFTGLSGFSFMLFNLLCVPCFAAVGAIRREMNSSKWTWFAILYECFYAYIISFMVFQFGSVFSGNSSLPGVIVASVFLILFMYLLFRKKKV